LRLRKRAAARRCLTYILEDRCQKGSLTGPDHRLFFYSNVHCCCAQSSTAQVMVCPAEVTRQCPVCGCYWLGACGELNEEQPHRQAERNSVNTCHGKLKRTSFLLGTSRRRSRMFKLTPPFAQYRRLSRSLMSWLCCARKFERWRAVAR